LRVAAESTTHPLCLLLGDRALNALDRALQVQALKDLDHLFVVLTQLAGKLINADLRHKSGPPPRGHRRLKSEELVKARESCRSSARSLQEFPLLMNMLGERHPQRLTIGMNTTCSSERPSEAAATHCLLEARAERANVGRATTRGRA
jgi:hypothetical protein